MSCQNVFKRYEKKYLLSKSQAEKIRNTIGEYMDSDAYGRSVICNLYFDTDNFLLIRNSIERPVYKEKLRLRCYGACQPDTSVFIELKKKCESVVYKRRTEATEAAAMRYLCGGKLADKPRSAVEGQIIHEIDYFLNRYHPLHPTVYLSYEREAFYARDDDGFRITFDQNILWRNTDLSLCSGVYGEPILQNDQVLMEIKTGTAIPLWMTAILSENRIYKTSFSKYGYAYRTIFSKMYTGGICYA